MHKIARIVKNPNCILLEHNALAEQDGEGRFCRFTECFNCGWNKMVAEKRKNYPLCRCEDGFWRKEP